MQDLQKLFKKYSNFYGTMERKEYWQVVLIAFGVGVLGTMILLASGSALGAFGVLVSSVGTIAIGIISAWIILASVARRCRDIGFNPYLCLTIFIPYLGWAAIVLFGVLDTKVKVSS